MALVHRVGLGRAVDLARGDEDEALDRGAPDRVEQDLRALDVRGHELGRTLLDRLLDVRLGRRVDDHVDAVDELRDECRIANVAVDERQPLVAHHVGEVLEVARVGQRVERDHLVPRVGEQVADHVRGDEAGTAGDEDAFHGTPMVPAFGSTARARSRTAAALDLALDPAEVLADEGEDEALYAEHEDHGRAEEQRAGEVRLADPVRDRVDAERRRSERADEAEHHARPLDRLRPEAREHVQREPRQPQRRVARRALAGGMADIDLGHRRAAGEDERLRELLPPDRAEHRRHDGAAVGVEGAAEVGDVDLREPAQHAVDQA